MPTTIRVINARDFVRATPEGWLDFTTSELLLLSVGRAAALLGDYDILLDTRKAKSVLTPFDVWHLARELAIHRGALGRKNAVLCPRERFDHAEFFALCAQDRGLPVRAFVVFEEAIEWLLAA